ncbi:MAG: DUF4230 domain-containing protein [Bacteroidota bacterium]
MTRTLFIALGLLLIFFSGMWLSNYYNKLSQLPPEEEATILLEQINKVCKLVTVEGHFVEYYDYREPDVPLFIGPLINIDALLPKKAAKLRISAKVLVGYDMKDLEINTYPDEKLIVLGNLPRADIIAIEHKIDEFDNDASIFRPLNSADYVKIDEGAQRKIEKMALSGQLVAAAEEQGNELIELIEFMVSNAGWRVEVFEAPVGEELAN